MLSIYGTSRSCCGASDLTRPINETCQVVEQKWLLSQSMPHQRIYRPGTPMTFTPDEAFEMEVYSAMDEFGIDYSRARYAVAELAVVTAIMHFGTRCRESDERAERQVP